MGDILKEAIADAKAVRETALENAKIALEEAFKPRIQSMLSAKLKEVEDEYEDEDEFGHGEEEEFPTEEGSYYEDEESNGEEEEEFGGGQEIPPEIAAAIAGGAGGEGGEEFGGGGEEEFGDEEEEFEEEGVIEINGVKYAPVVSEDDVFEDTNVDVTEETEEDVSNLDLEAIIRELENELEESDDPYDNNEQHDDWVDGQKGAPSDIHGKEKFAEGEEDSDDAIEEKLEDSTESDFDPTGAKKRSVDGKSQGSLKSEGEEDDDIVEIDLDEDDDSDEIDEELNSSGIGKGDQQSVNLSADTEDPQGQGVKKEKFSEGYVIGIRSELKEYKEAVEFLRDRLHEVNILNAKLLFTNKIFREFVLENNQKMKVVETFDRAQTVREIKLVYATLAESFKDNSTIKKQSIKETAGGSSKPVPSTKPSKKVINEEDEVANRFKELAGILNG